MAVLIKKEPDRIYQSLGNLGITQQDKERADELDGTIEERIEKLCNDLKRGQLLPKKAGMGSTATYWEVGRALREVADNSKLLNKTELPLFWHNVKIYLPDELCPRERGPYREHLWYCYRLASYPKGLAVKMNWGEWQEVFDSTGINQELRFDKWFKKTLAWQKETVGRSEIRMFARVANAMLGNIYTNDLLEKELFSCYEAAWQLADDWQTSIEKNKQHAISRGEIQTSIKKNIWLLSRVMGGTLEPSEYSKEILASIDK